MSEHEREGGERGGGRAIVQPDEVKIAATDAGHLHLDSHPILGGEGRLRDTRELQQGEGPPECRRIEIAQGLGENIPGQAVLELNGLQARPPSRCRMRYAPDYIAEGNETQPGRKRRVDFHAMIIV
jgi:hypothetical protein